MTRPDGRHTAQAHGFTETLIVPQRGRVLSHVVPQS